MSKPIFIKVGGSGPYDPAAGTTDCDIPIWAGVDGWVEAAGYGTLPPTAYTIKSTGGFRLVGSTFRLDDEYNFHPVGVQIQSASGSYSNGYNTAAVLSALFGRRGWAQTEVSGEVTLNTNNLICRSGRYFNNGHGHALTTLKNIQDVMENPDADESQINAFLESLQRGAILQSLNSVFNEPEYICEAAAYSNETAYDSNKVDNTGKFVGLEIECPGKAGLAVKIESISLWLDSAVTIPIYLYHSTKRAPIWSGSITTIANTETVAYLTDVVISHFGQANIGGKFYLGYYQSDLGSAKAIRPNCFEDAENVPFDVDFIESPIVSGNFDRSLISESGAPHGLNARLSVFRDHTQNIVGRAGLYDNLIGLTMDAKVIELILFSTRLNGTDSILKNNVMQALGSMALDGVAPVPDSPVIVGIKKQIAQEAARIKSSFQKKSPAAVVNLC